MDFLEFMRGKVGDGWVVARRTPRMIERYGENAVFLSRQAFQKLSDEFYQLSRCPHCGAPQEAQRTRALRPQPK